MDGMTKLDEKQIETIIRLIQLNQKFNTRYKYKNIIQVRKKNNLNIFFNFIYLM